jgi:peptide/nickel transport system permease protein
MSPAFNLSSRLAAGALALLLAASAAAPWIAPYDPSRQFRDGANAAPGSRFWLGSDDYGRDVFSRLLHAGRWSMLASGLALTLSLGLGTVLGLAASYAPPLVESTILWCADATQSLPWLYLLFALRGLLPLSLAPEVALLAVIALVGCAGWATPARLVRAAAQSVLTMDYVRASRAFGASRAFVLRHHVAPALGPVLTAQVFVLLPQYVLAESALSLLGLGIGEPAPTWGSLLGAARQQMASGLHWWTLAPIVPIMLLTLASTVLAERWKETS